VPTNGPDRKILRRKWARGSGPGQFSGPHGIATDRSGRVLPYSLVEARATVANIALRGGCFCNPGASEAALGLHPARTAACLESLGPSFTVERFAACTGTPVGAARASFGAANNDADVDRVLELIASFAS